MDLIQDELTSHKFKGINKKNLPNILNNFVDFISFLWLSYRCLREPQATMTRWLRLTFR